MRLRNKKTGETRDFIINKDKIQTASAIDCWEYSSIAELNKEWEDAPEEPKEFWFIDSGGEVVESTYITEIDKYNLRNFGNYFETEEDAKKAVKKLKAWQRLKDKGFRITLQDWGGNAWLEANWGNLQGDYSDVLFLFGSEEV